MHGQKNTRFLQYFKYFTAFTKTPQNITLEFQLIRFTLLPCPALCPDQPQTSVTLRLCDAFDMTHARVTSQRGCI